MDIAVYKLFELLENPKGQLATTRGVIQIVNAVERQKKQLTLHMDNVPKCDRQWAISSQAPVRVGEGSTTIERALSGAEPSRVQPSGRQLEWNGSRIRPLNGSGEHPTVGEDIVSSAWKHVAAGNSARWKSRIHLKLDMDVLSVIPLIDDGLVEVFKIFDPRLMMVSRDQPGFNSRMKLSKDHSLGISVLTETA